VPPPLDRRLDLAVLPTPLEPADRLGAALGMGPGALWIKRDDLTGLAGGGNKARKLEYLCADALAQGADVLVTGGGAQSNHVRMTAAAANRLGLACTVVVAGPRPADATGNGVLLELLGPELVYEGRAEGPMEYEAIEVLIDETADRLAAEGRRPYRMPIGGATAVGALGYVQAAIELRRQDPAVDLVVVADGSGGTHAGLVAGLGDHRAVYGVDVGARPDLDDQVPAKAAEVARLAGLPDPRGDPAPDPRGDPAPDPRGDPAPDPRGGPAPDPHGGSALDPHGGPAPGAALPRAVVDHDRFGPGYGGATDECREALRLAARLEGLVLDPVYTGKAMAGLIAGVESGRIPTDARVVFLHTGGMPALFASGYGEWLRAAPGWLRSERRL
jgi:D-cysteine desulfhydrase